MNITLSVDQELVESSREYAKKNGTSLNNLIREYLKNITGIQDAAASAEEFEKLAKSFPGKSEEDVSFNRDSLYERGSSK